MNGSTKIAIFILIIVVIAGEISSPDSGSGQGKVRPRIIIPEEQSLPPMPDIVAEGIGIVGPPSSFDPIITIEEAAKDANQQFTGTAFSIDKRGLWITARHVTDGCDNLFLLRPNRRAVKVVGVAQHDHADVSILHTEGGAVALPIDYNAPIFNQEGFHFGFPRGEPGEVYSRLVGRRTIMTTGVRKSKETVHVWAEKIRNPDNDLALGGISGGPILNEQGSVVGVHVAGSVRRGRSFSSMPSKITDLLEQTELDLMEGEGVLASYSHLTPERLSDAGRDLRNRLTVAQIICTVNDKGRF